MSNRPVKLALFISNIGNNVLWRNNVILGCSFTHVLFLFVVIAGKVCLIINSFKDWCGARDHSSEQFRSNGWFLIEASLQKSRDE